MRSGRGIAAVLSAVLVIAAAVEVRATAQQAGQSPAPMETEEVVDPGATEEQADPIDEAPPENEAPQPGEEPTEAGGELEQAGFGNAAQLPPLAKRAEVGAADTACRTATLPTSEMLAIANSVGRDTGSPIGFVLLGIATVALLVMITAWQSRRRSDQRERKRSTRGALETVTAVIGASGIVAGLTLQVFPGLVMAEGPARSAELEVRDVQARVTRGEYADATRTNVRLSEHDQRELGNVVWLEVRLQGLGDVRPLLQYSLHDFDLGRVLIPGTARKVTLRPKGEDIDNLFVPVWVGYPKSARFTAHFRLVDERRQVLGIAKTGKMRGPKFRYACAG